MTLLEGPHLLDAALAAAVAPRRVFACADDPFFDRWPEPTLVTAQVMAKLAGTETPVGPVAVIETPPSGLLRPDKHVLVLWEVSDPGNAGTIVRSAAAFGLGVATGPGTTDIWSPKALRAGAGAHFRTPITLLDNLDNLAAWRKAATVVAGGIGLDDLGGGTWAVLIGSEPHGLPGDIVAACDTSVTIPLPGGVESLNAASAATIVAYELAKGSGAGRPDH